MTKIDIISGFLGAGKTTLIKKLIEEGLKGQKVVLIENEFGEIGIDGGFLKESGIQINEMNSGCICCSLVGDFNTALKDVLEQYTPDRIIIEPSGVGKLSDVMKAVQKVVDAEENVVLNSHITVADAMRAKMYLKNFGEFYRNQVEFASAVILSRSQNVKEDKLEKAVALLRDINGKCPIVTTPWEELSGAQLLEVMEGENDFAKELMEARAKYLELITYARKVMPDLVLTSDVIIGFPGETEAEAMETVELVRQVEFDALFTFIFSPRPGTPAAKMDDPVPRSEKQKWFDTLCAVQNDISARLHARYVGQTLRVLVDGRTDDARWPLSARTAGGRLVHLVGDEDALGQYRQVRITDSNTWALFGEMV